MAAESAHADHIWAKSSFSIWQVNIQGFLSSCAELVARIRTAKVKPSLICINATFLDCSVGEVALEGYVLIGRRDRDDGHKGSGVAVFAQTLLADCITLLLRSKTHEK